MRRLVVLIMGTLIAIGALPAAGSLAGVATASSSKVLQFHTMVGVSGPFLLAAGNPIRGINGGGAAWTLGRATGELRADGGLEVKVHGLVLVATGTNPVANFKGMVSCLSIDGGGNLTTVNVATGLFPATPTGDAKIEAQLALPSPCVAPIIFVTSPGGRWLAATGQ